MEQKKLKLILNKSGNGNINPRFPIPIDWFRRLGFTEQEFEADAIIDDENQTLIIKKAK